MKLKMKMMFQLLLLVSLIFNMASIAMADSVKKKSENGKVQIVIEFDDLQSAEWALKYISKMQAKSVFTGFPDGSFQPQQPISRVQAVVTAVRLMGLEDEAKAKENVSLGFKDSAQIEQKFGWALGYIAVALEHGLFDTSADKLEPEKPASRLWTSTLLVKALGLEKEALQKMNTKLSFKDADVIPAGAVGYVAVAEEKGIITGYPDGTFQPEKKVTRAEMAAFLERTDNQIVNSGSPSSNEIEGQIQSVGQNSLVVKTDEGDVTVPFTSDTAIFLGDYKGQGSELQAGDDVQIELSDGVAIYIEADVEKEEYTGTVISLEKSDASVTDRVYATSVLTVDTEDNGEMQFYLTEQTKLKFKGKSKKDNLIMAGDKVELKALRERLLEIKIERDKRGEDKNDEGKKEQDKEDKKGSDNQGKDFEIVGKITALSDGTIVITDKRGITHTYPISDEVEIKISGQDSAGLEDLQLGMAVKIEGEGKSVTKIEVDEEGDEDE